MKAEEFIKQIKNQGITNLIGVPDSTLKPFCDYLQNEGKDSFKHYVPVNEGAAVGMAIGYHLATGKAACLYMQNSGLGNIVNPITSLAHQDVYGIPMLLLIGWRGEPGKKDEPQHKFMGNVTVRIVEDLEIKYAIVGKDTSIEELQTILAEAKTELHENRQFAIIVKKDFFDTPENSFERKNSYSLVREDAISEIIRSISPEDVVVSTTGKISREVYEQSDAINGQHKQDFLTVGGMGHASMIALGIAQEKMDKRVYCLDGDGAVLMHMGSLAFVAKQNPKNLVHICLNNNAHESVGGMPTGCVGADFAQIAKVCGYPKVYTAETKEELKEVLEKVRNDKELTFIEIKVALSSRSDLGRPKESARENKESFMKMFDSKTSIKG